MSPKNSSWLSSKSLGAYALVLATAGCGCDAGGADAAIFDGGTGGADGALTYDEFLAGGCITQGACEGVAQYAACVRQRCDEVYRGCLGDRYLERDFSGSPCESHYACVIASGDFCQNDCRPDDACASCVFDEIVPCIEASACPRPVCNP